MISNISIRLETDSGRPLSKFNGSLDTPDYQVASVADNVEYLLENHIAPSRLRVRGSNLHVGEFNPLYLIRAT